MGAGLYRLPCWTAEWASTLRETGWTVGGAAGRYRVQWQSICLAGPLSVPLHCERLAGLWAAPRAAIVYSGRVSACLDRGVGLVLGKTGRAALDGAPLFRQARQGERLSMERLYLGKQDRESGSRWSASI